MMNEKDFSNYTETNLNECEKRYCSLINNVNIGIFRSLPLPGRFVTANPAMPRIFGYDSVEELLGVAVTDLYVDAMDRDKLLEELKRKGSIKNKDIPMKRKDGKSIWCLATITAEYDRNGEIRWLDGVMEDITERKIIQIQQQQAIEELEIRVRERFTDLVESNRLLTAEIAERRRVEEKLRENYQFMEVLINAIPSPVFYKGADGVYQGCNSAFERYLGRSREEIVGCSDFDIAPEEQAEKYRGMDRALMKNLGVHDYETCFVDAEGSQHNVIIIKTAYPNKGGVGGVIGIMVDVTDLRRLEEEQLKVEKLESLGVLAGGIAHDFNNIITGILGNISLARIFIDPSHRSSRQLEEAEKASQRAAELAYQLLTFAKGGAPIKKIVSLRNIVDESVSFILRGSNIQGVIDIPDTLHAIEADEGQLSQAFGNIILNALQAMPEGGTLDIRAEDVVLGEFNSMSLPPGEYAKISFSDQGCGISDENRKKIFDPYFTTKKGGTGLGLSSTYSIIKKHGGQIDLHSSPGAGTTFTCFLPSTGRMISGCKDTQSSVLPDHQGGSVLVMDDEEMIRSFAAEMLDYLGYQAVTCKTGEEAIMLYREAKVAGSPFFAVIMDLTIPGGMGGREAAQQILAVDPTACLIVSSGYSDNPVMAEYRKFGFSGAVIKPYVATEISTVLSNVRKMLLKD